MSRSHSRKGGILVQILVVIAGLLLVFGLTKNVIFKMAIEGIGQKAVGVRLSVGRAAIGVFRPRMEVANLKVYNPRGFREKLMADAPLIAIQYDPGSLFSGRVHIPEMRLHVKEITVVKNAQGQTNVQVIQKKDQKEAPAARKEGRKEPKKVDLQVDELYLTLGQVIFVDYTAGDPPTIRRINLGVKDKLVKNVRSTKDIPRIILVLAIERAGLGDLGLDLNTLKDSFVDIEGMGFEEIKGILYRMKGFFGLE